MVEVASIVHSVNHGVVHSFNSDSGSGVDEETANEKDIVLVDGIVQQPHLKGARR